MEPETPAPNNVTNAPGSPSTQSPNAPNQSIGQTPATSPSNNGNRKKLLIILGVILVLILGAGIIKAATSSKSKSTNSGTSYDSSLYHFRDGYNIKQYGSSIGDPMALSMAKLDEPFKTSTGNIVYACNLVTQQELYDKKIYITPREDDRAIGRTFIDGVGKKSPESNVYTLPSADDDNNCNYSMQSGGLVSLSVYQPPFTTMDAVQDTLDRNYSKTSDIGGLATYQYSKARSSGNHEYMLVSGKQAINVLFNGTKLSEAQAQTILTTAAQNFVAQQAAPKGPAIPTYDTPTYKQKWARACDVISNDDIKNLTGSDASIYVTEGLASGTAVSKVNDQLYNSITTSCARYNTGLGSGIGAGPFNQKLELTVTSFNSDVAAKYFMGVTKKDAGSSKVDANIGSEGLGFRDKADQNTVAFRQGRFVAEIVFDRTSQKNVNLTDTSAMTQKLTPYAQQVAAKLKSLE